MTNIELLESILRNNCPFVLDNLQSGLSEQQIGELLTDSSLNYDEIRALYSWRNGMSEQYKPCFSKYSFHPFGNLIPLQKAVLVKKENETKNRWDRRLFPIISNNEGDYLLMDIDKNSKTYGFL